MNTIFPSLLLFAGLLLATVPVPAANFELRAVTLANGGGIGSGGSFNVSDTVGQSVQGTVSGGNFVARLGFQNLIRPAGGVSPGVDLHLAANRSNVLATENLPVTLTLNTINRGPEPATGVQLLVNLPVGLRVTAASNNAGGCVITASNVTCSVAILGTNGIFAVDLTLRPNFLPPASELTVNLSDLTAIVTSSESELTPPDNALALPVTVRTQTDWADGRGGFPVTAAEDGPFHRYSTNAPWLGLRWDNETPTGVHSRDADWDDLNGAGDDEDGIVFPASIFPGTTVSLVVTCSWVAGRIDAWADFNRNTNFADVGEKIFNSVRLEPGPNTLTFTVPAGASPGPITTRWRVSLAGGLGFTGYGGPGEVEDHIATISALPAVFSGLPHVSLGGAAVSLGSNGLQVANLGTNGQDGVNIGVGQVNGWQATLLHQLNAGNRTDGSRIEWTAFGEKNGQANQPIIYGRLERTADCLALHADGSLVGATAFDVEVLSNGVVLASARVNSGSIAALRPRFPVPLGRLDPFRLIWQGLTGPRDEWCYGQWERLLEFDDEPVSAACDAILDGEYIPDSDTIRFRPASMTATVGAFSEVQLRGVNSGDFWLRDEAVAQLGAYLQAGDGTTLLSESNRVRFLPDANGVSHARILTPESTDTASRCLAFHTPGVALAASNAAATFTAHDTAGNAGSLTLRRLPNGRLGIINSILWGGAGSVDRVIVEMFTSTSRVARISLPAGDLGTLSGAGRIVTAGVVLQGLFPIWSVVFDAPMSFAAGGNAGGGKAAEGVVQAATGLRVYPDYDHDRRVWSVLDRFDVDTLNEQLMEWIDQIIIWCPGPARPRPDQLIFGARPRLTFATDAGVDYLVQSWDDLGSGTPATLQRVTGTGGVMTIEDPRSATVQSRFFRVVPAQESLWQGLRGMW